MCRSGPAPHRIPRSGGPRSHPRLQDPPSQSSKICLCLLVNHAPSLLRLRPPLAPPPQLCGAGSTPRLQYNSPLPYAPPPRSRARSGRRRRTWREIGKCFSALPRQLQFLRRRDETGRHADASERRLRPGAAGAARVLTPARLPLRARPAGVRAPRGPGRGEGCLGGRAGERLRARWASRSDPWIGNCEMGVPSGDAPRAAQRRGAARFVGRAPR